MNQPDAFAVRFQNDLGSSTLLALCNRDHSRTCRHPAYREKLAAGKTTEENISPDLKTEWAVEAPDGHLVRCVLLYWKYAPNRTPTVRFSSAPAWSSPCSRMTSSTSLHHALAVTIRGKDRLCLSAVPQPPLGRPTKVSDTFELRAPGKGTGAAGRILARSTGAAPIDHGCAVRVSFKISRNVGPFSFYDATNGGIWSGLSSAKLPRTGGGSP